MRKRTNFGIVGFAILCGLFTGCEDTPRPQVDVVQNAASRSAGYLAKSTREDGMFLYRINLNPAIVVPQRYNILRHAAAIYAMSMHYQLQPDTKVKSAMERAGRYLRDESMHPVPGEDNMLAIWTEPEVSRSEKPRQAKLGGAGLGLVALLSLENIQPGFTPLPDLQALGRFTVYMQKEDGSFYSKYIPSMGGRWDKWRSLFYPGEAALGLIMLYQKDPSEIWIESATRALTYLARSRQGSTHVPADHWALLATSRLLSLENIDELMVPRKLLINHAIQVCETILRSQIKESGKPGYDGGFSEDGTTTPTATHLEGLQAALTFLPAGHQIRRRIDYAVLRGIAFLLRAQVKEGEFIGAIPMAIGRLDQNNQKAEVFNRRATEVRIDYVQHALSAMIQYIKLTSDKK